MGTGGGVRGWGGQEGTNGNEWGQMGTYGVRGRCMGTYGDVWGQMGTYGVRGRCMGTYGDVWDHMGMNGATGSWGGGGDTNGTYRNAWGRGWAIWGPPHSPGGLRVPTWGLRVPPSAPVTPLGGGGGDNTAVMWGSQTPQCPMESPQSPMGSPGSPIGPSPSPAVAPNAPP